jgi:hypothetical protein
MYSEAIAQNDGFPPQADQCSGFSVAFGRERPVKSKKKL